jgi:hypothetical protein
VLLADEFVEGARAHAIGEGALAVDLTGTGCVE